MRAEPTVVTIPSPTRAIIVSSPAPPTNRSMLARTVTFALAINSIPSFATAETFGVSITFGLTETWTASNTLRPARSMAAACSKGKSIFALSEAINASITSLISPPAKWCASNSSISKFNPALVALI